MSQRSASQQGYMLVYVILLGTALTVLFFALFDSANVARTSLEQSIYRRMANDAAQSGMEYAYDQVATTPGFTGITAPTDCNNSSSTLSPYIINNSTICTSFTVQETSEGKFVSTGVVMRKYGTAAAATTQHKYVATIPGAVAGAGPVNVSSITRVEVGGTNPTSSAYNAGVSFTPNSSRVLIAHVAAVDEGSASAFPSDASNLTISGGGLTWVPIIGQSRTARGNYDVAYRAFYAIVNTSPGNMQVTVDAGTFTVRYSVAVDEFNGVNMSTPVAGAVAAGRASSGGNLFTATLTATPTANDVKIGFANMDEDNAPSAYDIPSGWNQEHKMGYSPETQIIDQTGSTNTTVNFDLSTSVDYGGTDTVYGGFIVKAASSGGGGGGTPATISRVSRVEDGANSPTSAAFNAGTSWTPSANRVLVAHVAAIDENGAAAFPTDASNLTISGGGLTWVPIIGQSRTARGNYDVAYRAFYAIVGGSPASTQISVDAGTFTVRFAVAVDEYSGVSSTAPVTGAVAAGRATSGSQLFTATLTATPSTNDMKIGFINLDEDNSPSAYDTPAGWTQQHKMGYSPEAQIIEQIATTTTVNFDTSGSVDYANADSVYGGFILKAAIN